jgi:16S rRNA (adenine1518-N6/adenine1519-N6)-dimethyltransferase
MSKLSDPRTMLETISRYDFDFHKKFGQNFLIDEGVIRRSLEAAQFGKDDVIFEIGPGVGTLTQFLADAAHQVVSIEIDKKLIPILEDTLRDYDNVEVINEDVLKVDLVSLAHQYHAGRVNTGNTDSGSISGANASREPASAPAALAPLRIVANLPYYITTPILMNLFRQRVPAQSITVMVQKEVAERIAEKPGSKTYGILSVLLQAWYDIEYLFTVEPGAFAPPPKVRSAVIRLTRNGRTDLGCDEKMFRQVVKMAFNQRRKTLRNALKPLLNDDLRALPILDLRAERLSVEDFVFLTKALER